MQFQDKIRWGIIGCGSVCEVKSGPAFYRAANSELVAVMRRQGDLAGDFARRHNVARWYDNAGALINEPAVDAVYIATPPGSHLELALKVCAAGKPAYVEKPMARNYTECRKMVDAFAAAKVPLFVGYYRRELPRFLKVTEILDSGELGRIIGVTYKQSVPPMKDLNSAALPWRLQAEHSGGGLFLDVGSHTLDRLDSFFGRLNVVSGLAFRGTTYDVESRVVMEFKVDGVAGPCAAVWNFAAEVYEDEMLILGSKGDGLSFSIFGNEPVVFLRRDNEMKLDLPSPFHVHQPLIQTIVNELLGTGTCSSTGESAARTSLVMDTVLEKYYGGRQDDFWIRPQTWPEAPRHKR